MEQLQHDIRDQTMQLTPIEDIEMAIDVLREGIKHLQDLICLLQGCARSSPP